MNGAFQKLLFLLFLVVAFKLDWSMVFDGLDDKTSGPEAGRHLLHASRRTEDLVHGAVLGIKGGAVNGGKSSQHSQNNKTLAEPQSYAQIPGFDNVAKEMAMARLGEKPYPEQFSEDAAPLTPAFPSFGSGEDETNDTDETDDETYYETPDRVTKPKKTREELEAMDTFGADERIVQILRSARVEIDEEMAKELPTWDDVVEMYGEEPIIEGLDTCKEYRTNVDAADRMIGPAGMFNTGTNLLWQLLKTNCWIEQSELGLCHLTLCLLRCAIRQQQNYFQV